MNDQQKQAMQMALEALEALKNTNSYWWQEVHESDLNNMDKAITALREALAQPDHIANAGKVIEPSDYDRKFWGDGQPQGEWVDLTPHEVTEAIREGAADGGWQGFAQRIVAKFKEKNAPVMQQDHSEQEPVAWLMELNGVTHVTNKEPKCLTADWVVTSLYTAPPTASQAARQMRDAAVKVCANLRKDGMTQDWILATYECSEAIASLPIIGEDK